MADAIQAYYEAELKEKAKFELENPGKKFIAKFEGCQPTIAFTRRINELLDILNSCEKDKSLTLGCPAFEVTSIELILIHKNSCQPT